MKTFSLLFIALLATSVFTQTTSPADLMKCLSQDLPKDITDGRDIIQNKDWSKIPTFVSDLEATYADCSKAFASLDLNDDCKKLMDGVKADTRTLVGFVTAFDWDNATKLITKIENEVMTSSSICIKTENSRVLAADKTTTDKCIKDDMKAAYTDFRKAVTDKDLNEAFDIVMDINDFYHDCIKVYDDLIKDKACQAKLTAILVEERKLSDDVHKIDINGSMDELKKIEEMVLDAYNVCVKKSERILQAAKSTPADINQCVKVDLPKLATDMKNISISTISQIMTDAETTYTDCMKVYQDIEDPKCQAAVQAMVTDGQALVKDVQSENILQAVTDAMQMKTLYEAANTACNIDINNFVADLPADPVADVKQCVEVDMPKVFADMKAMDVSNLPATLVDMEKTYTDCKKAFNEIDNAQCKAAVAAIVADGEDMLNAVESMDITKMMADALKAKDLYTAAMTACSTAFPALAVKSDILIEAHIERVLVSNTPADVNQCVKVDLAKMAADLENISISNLSQILTDAEKMIADCEKVYKEIEDPTCQAAVQAMVTDGEALYNDVKSENIMQAVTDAMQMKALYLAANQACNMN